MVDAEIEAIFNRILRAWKSTRNGENIAEMRVFRAAVRALTMGTFTMIRPFGKETFR
jgi:hypothetical protein